MRSSLLDAHQTLDDLKHPRDLFRRELGDSATLETKLDPREKLVARKSVVQNLRAGAPRTIDRPIMPETFVNLSQLDQQLPSNLRSRRRNRRTSRGLTRGHLIRYRILDDNITSTAACQGQQHNSHHNSTRTDHNEPPQSPRAQSLAAHAALAEGGDAA